jgi:methionine sulfoxide reductase heme-binding subunit
MIAAVPVAQHAFWIASRAAGVVALALVSASVLLGLAMAARLPRAPAWRRRVLGLHEQIALTALCAIAAHALLLLGDPWLHPGLAGIALPFRLQYRPLFTGLGILGGYLTTLLTLSFYVRRRIGVRLWRRLHRLTPAVYALAVVHVLGAGSDASAPWLRAVVLAPAPAAAVLVLARLAGRRGRRPLPQGARP